MALDRSVNTTLSNADFSWREAPFAQCVVESYEPSNCTAVVRHHPGTLKPDDPCYRKADHAQVCGLFTATGDKILSRGATPFFDLRADDLGGGRYRIYFDTKNRPGMNKFRPLPGDVIDGYVRSGGYEGRETCYFYYTRDLPGPGHFRELLPAVHDFYERIGTMLSFERIPVLREIFSVGFHFWLLLGTLFYLRWRRRQAGALLLLLAYALLSALCPLILVRYFAALYLAFPLLLASLLQPGRLYAEQPRAVTVSADPK